MADRTITTNEDALTAAIDAQALLAMSKLRLWDGVVPVDVTTPVATLGAWIETAAGDPYKTYIFDPPIPLAAVPDGFTFIREIVFPSG